MVVETLYSICQQFEKIIFTQHFLEWRTINSGLIGLGTLHIYIIVLKPA